MVDWGVMAGSEDDMTTQPWVKVYEASGEGLAEIVCGLLGAQEIPTLISQEAIGRVYGFTVGPAGLAQILVPADRALEAAEIIRRYEDGEFESVEKPPADQG
jgi:hypothetical protein